MRTPTEQLTALFKALGVENFDAATARATELTSASANLTNWQTEQAAIFNGLGVKDHAGAVAAITQFTAEREGFFTALNVTSYADAIPAIDRMNADLTARQSTIDTLTTQNGTLTTDLATARTRITTLEASQSDFDGRVQTEVKKQIASAGMTVPIAKVVEHQNAGPVPQQQQQRKQSHLQRAIALQEAKKSGAK